MESKSYDDQSPEMPYYSTDEQQEYGSESQSYIRPMSAMPTEMQEMMELDEDSQSESE